MNARTWVTLVILPLAAAGPAVVEAQTEPGGGEDLPCEVRLYDVNMCSGYGSHRTADNSVRNAKGQSHSGLCFVCYDGETPVSPYECHAQNCLGDGGDPAAAAAYAELVKAARRGDLAVMLDLVAEVPRMIEVNRQRRSVQLRTCSGAIIGSLLLDDDKSLRLFEAAIATADAAVAIRDARRAFRAPLL